eukprot:TRINITY_DN8418_c0_g1_i3.p1 TRINITY_DN8418_c0_g1~~TRINITY_DN8418_c0_g1_i3.p1  ORF type:complete len:664 (-),score=99.18 TRINITY_DN8418_c0_g1_i3:158-2149(-)
MTSFAWGTLRKRESTGNSSGVSAFSVDTFESLCSFMQRELSELGDRIERTMREELRDHSLAQPRKPQEAQPSAKRRTVVVNRSHMLDFSKNMSTAHQDVERSHMLDFSKSMSTAYQDVERSTSPRMEFQKHNSEIDPRFKLQLESVLEPSEISPRRAAAKSALRRPHKEEQASLGGPKLPISQWETSPRQTSLGGPKLPISQWETSPRQMRAVSIIEHEYDPLVSDDSDGSDGPFVKKAGVPLAIDSVSVLAVPFPDVASRYPHAAKMSRRRSAYAKNEALLRQSWVASFAHFLVHDAIFEFLTMCMVVMNAISIGVETDFMARTLSVEPPIIFELFDRFLCIFFLFELGMLLHIGDWQYFSERPWTLYHFCVVLLQVTEKTIIIFQISGCEVLLTTLRSLRPIRILRVFRLLETSYVTPEVRVLFVSIKSSVRSLGCSFFVLFIFTYTCSVPITMIVTTYTLTHPENDEARHALEGFYGSLDRSMLALFQAITDGFHWRELLEPLEKHCSPWFTVVFVIYIGFTQLAVMNILTGLFVESAIKTAEEDKRRGVGNKMRKIFEAADSDGSGTISYCEFMFCMEKDPLMAAYLSALDIRTEQAKELFRLLDTDCSGEVDYDEFTQGCIRLQGPVKAIDFAAFIVEWRMLNLHSSVGDQDEQEDEK